MLIAGYIHSDSMMIIWIQKCLIFDKIVSRNFMITISEYAKLQNCKFANYFVIFFMISTHNNNTKFSINNLIIDKNFPRLSGNPKYSISTINTFLRCNDSKQTSLSSKKKFYLQNCFLLIITHTPSNSSNLFKVCAYTIEQTHNIIKLANICALN